MEGVFLGGSLLAAFVAGSVALFAPCCIMVMFPAYLAAAVRNHRWRLVPLTLVFAAGVATVLVPVTLGLTVLTQGLLRFHGVIYIGGGLLLLVLAGVAATGGTWSLPFLRSAPDLSRTDSAGVYALGVFSGAASACCAPVLAGVLTLSAVSPGLLTGIGIGRLKTSVYVLSGLLAAVSGVVLVTVQGQGKADLATGYELDIIASAVVGGASLSGGRGSVVGAVLGTLIFGVLRNALPQIPGATFYDRLIVGLVVIVIVVMDQMLLKKAD